MYRVQNYVLNRTDNKPIVMDWFFSTEHNNQPVAIFCHGYKGFKDWGPWSLMCHEMAKSGICVVKFNFSHNGGTVDDPIDFPDLEAFGQNNYTKELNDLGDVIDWCISHFETNPNINTNSIHLLGHSRGGGMVVLKAAEDSRVKKIITLAGVSDYKSRFPKGEDFDKWKKDGVAYVKNGRTLQDMPHYFQYYEDFVENEKRLTISKAAKELTCPFLIIQGTNDEAVKPFEAERLHQWCSHSELHWLVGTDHVFNSKHPWNEKNLTVQLQEVVEKMIPFIFKKPTQ